MRKTIRHLKKLAKHNKIHVETNWGPMSPDRAPVGYLIGSRSPAKNLHIWGKGPQR
jgi:hypothetical protein